MGYVCILYICICCIYSIQNYIRTMWDISGPSDPRPTLPPGTAAAWRQILSYCGSCYKRLAMELGSTPIGFMDVYGRYTMVYRP